MSIDKPTLDYYYNNEFDFSKFKSKDPCGIVYKLLEHTTNQLDIELGALFVAMISWGSRKVILPTALNMLSVEMSWSPSSFILDRKYMSSYKSSKNNCVYRTLNTTSFKSVCDNVYNVLSNCDSSNISLEELFNGKSTKEVIQMLCNWLSPAKVGTMDKSACKRMCMYTRWMTRSSAPDFGIWKSRSQSDLYAVMDVHVRALTQDILTSRGASWKSCVELTNIFKSWDPSDPLKYDVALMTLSDILDEQKKIKQTQLRLNSLKC